MMSIAAEQRVLKLDAKISDLKSDLDKIKSDENADIAQRLRIVSLEKEIQQLRTILNYTLHDIRRPFHYYRLPAEMRAEIFKWVTSPQDQLTLLKMFPETGPLMYWDESTLYFSMVYPLVYPYIFKNWQASLQLCKVSPQFQQIVLGHHKKVMSRGVYQYPWNTGASGLIKFYNFNQEPETLTNVINEIDSDDYSGCPWMNVAAMPFLFGIEFSELTRQSLNDPLLQSFLERYGERNMAYDISFEDFDNEWIVFNDNDWFLLLNGFLSRPPNLHYLAVFVDLFAMSDFGLIANNGNREVQDYPDLPHLKFVSTSHAPPNFIQQYGPALKTLWINGDVPAINGNCLQLEVCVIERPANIPASFSNSLSYSPLKVLALEFNRWRNPISMPVLLQNISRYGRTLEKLYIDYSLPMVVADDWSNLENEWMILVDLPNLKVLKLWNYVGKLDFMLALPSLTKLYLSRCRPVENPEGQGDGVHVPDLFKFPWWNDNRKYETNIWNYLAKLKYLHVQCPRNWNVFSITRSEHEEYQRSREGTFAFWFPFYYFP